MINQIFKKALLSTAFFIALNASSPAYASNENCLKIGNWFGERLAAKIFKAMVEETYKHANLCMTFVNIPIKRAEIMLKNGELDGNIIRSDVFLETHSEYAIGIQPPMIDLTSIILYNQDKFESPVTRKSFQNKKVAHSIGDVFGIAMIKNLGGESMPLRGRDKIIELLQSERIDSGISTLEELKIFGFIGKLPKNIKILTLEELKAFHTLNVKHRNLIPRISKAIKKTLLAGGLFERMEKSGIP